MKLKKAAVLEFIDDALKKSKESFERRKREQAATYARELAAWEGHHGAEWDAALKKIGAARRAGKPITMELLPVMRERYSNHDIAVFTRFDQSDEKYSEPQDLRGMRSLVAAIIGDEVDMREASSASVRAMYAKYTT